MPERLGHDGKMAYINAFRLYVCPNGELVVTTGNVKLIVSADEAAELLKFVLLHAERFHTGNIRDIELVRGVFDGHATS